MVELTEQYELTEMFPLEVTQLVEELERIKDKYSTAHEPCGFEVTAGERNSQGQMLVFLSANQAMIRAYIIEQIL